VQPGTLPSLGSVATTVVVVVAAEPGTEQKKVGNWKLSHQKLSTFTQEMDKRSKQITLLVVLLNTKSK
jgi:hypothetical protein